MNNLKTTLAGLAIGAYPIIDALIKAYAAGQFKGETGLELVAGIATIVLGVVANDPKKTSA